MFQFYLELCSLLVDLPAKVNLIPYNDVPGTGFKVSSSVAIEAFREVLVKAGVMTMTRKNRGPDIDAACGQLMGQISREAGESVASSP